MRTTLLASLCLAAALPLAGCGDDATNDTTGDEGAWSWDLPDGVPLPASIDDNPMTVAKVELGRFLFYDTRLSGNETQSCASCHDQSLAFTDGLSQAVGSTGEVHPRSSMSLVNMAYTPRFTWANPLLDRMSHQARLPLFGETPVELGMSGREGELLQRLADATDPDYPALFADAFAGEDDPITVENVTLALEAFQRSIVSFDSPYDRYLRGDTTALDDAELRGLELFFSERLECFHCHGGLNFSDSLSTEHLPEAEVAFHNTGLYNIDGAGAYPAGGEGLFEISGEADDMGRFRAPTLRNIAVTAPYMHDGSAATLEDVIAHYAAGGRTIEDGPYAGDGSENPYKSSFIGGFLITDAEMADLIAFLEALTDDTLLTNPAYSDPFAGDR